MLICILKYLDTYSSRYTPVTQGVCFKIKVRKIIVCLLMRVYMYIAMYV